MGLKDLILRAIDKDYLLEIKHKRVAFLNMTAVQILTHLRNRWGVVDFVDITALMSKCDALWSIVEVPTIYFNQVEKTMKQLAKANITWDWRAMMNKALKSFKGWRIQARHLRMGSMTCSNSDMGQSEDFDVH
jgi:hypothetical protein